MKYKNIVFDFGNVIGTFNGREIIRSLLLMRLMSIISAI